MLERENAFYKSHQTEYQEKYLYKWLIIANESLFGVYSTPKDALVAAQEHFGEGEFLLHRPVDDDMTLEVGPMGVVRLHRPHEVSKKMSNPTITVSKGEPITFAYA
jgi:hypothetical protein